ncbi:AIR carboxylase family protein, partial [Ornithobacterium rhinotracheale]
MHIEKPTVYIVMGSQSDLPKMQAAAEILQELGITFELTLGSAHRTPERMFDDAKGAAER